MPQIFGGQFGAGKKRGGCSRVGVETDGSRCVYSEARRTEEGRYAHEIMGEDIVVAQVAVDRIGLGRETERAAIGGTDGKGTAIRKGEGKSRKRFRREEVTEFGEEDRRSKMCVAPVSEMKEEREAAEAASGTVGVAGGVA